GAGGPPETKKAPAGRPRQPGAVRVQRCRRLRPGPAPGTTRESACGKFSTSVRRPTGRDGLAVPPGGVRPEGFPPRLHQSLDSGPALAPVREPDAHLGDQGAGVVRRHPIPDRPDEVLVLLASFHDRPLFVERGPGPPRR